MAQAAVSISVRLRQGTGTGRREEEEGAEGNRGGGMIGRCPPSLTGNLYEYDGKRCRIRSFTTLVMLVLGLFKLIRQSMKRKNGRFMNHKHVFAHSPGSSQTQ